MSLLPPVFIDAVIAIGNPTTTDVQWVGSGFLYGAKEPMPSDELEGSAQKYSLWLITNRHVVVGLNNPVIRFDASDSGQSIQIELATVAEHPSWTCHSDPEFDVAAIRLNINVVKRINAKLAFFEEEKSAATLKDLETLGVHEGNGGFILGFPLGLVDSTTGSVIARKSSIARIRNAYAGTSRVILVDGSVFPGNSGGPAIIHPEPFVITGTSPIQNAYLIGIVTSYVTYRDVAVSPKTGQQRVVFEENTGLTNVLSVDCINEVILEAKAAIKSRRP